MTSNEWLAIAIVVATSTASAMAFLYRIRMSIHRDMLELDARWQARSDRIAESIRRDIESVRKQIPPDWFRSMVEHNTERIEHNTTRIERLEVAMAERCKEEG